MRTRVGYAGGTTQNPTYTKIGDHTETIQIDFDPAKITYAQIVDLIWASHNPCASSYSRQYMSAIFYATDAQKKLLEESRAKQEKKLGKKVQTALLPVGTFTLAEDYHQKYSLRNVRELMKEFAAIYPAEKDFVNSTAAARVNGYLAGDGTREQLQKELDLLGLSDEGKKRLQAHVIR